jgi:ketosteroid isomerase-like protein
MSQFEDDDAAEAAFYQAFENCDIKAMELIWARDDVICIHPGSSALVGHDVVMQSWSNILLNAQQPQLQYDVIRRTSNQNLAIHVVKELISPAEFPLESAMIFATNVYVRDHDNGWLLYAHHASATRQKFEKHTLQ